MNKVTIDKNSRSVTLNMDGVEINITFTRLRALTSAGLDDAIAEAHGIDTSPEADAELAVACGEMEARKTGKLREAVRTALVQFYVDTGALGRDHVDALTDSLVPTIEATVADDDVIREAYSRDYAKVLEAIDVYMKDVPALRGQSGNNAIYHLAAELLTLQDEVAALRDERDNPKPGSPAYRLDRMLRELEDRFPNAVDKFSSRASEPEYLKAIDAVRTVNSKTVLPERKAAKEIGRILHERGWNACLDEMRRLNPHLKGPTYFQVEQAADKPTLYVPLAAGGARRTPKEQGYNEGIDAVIVMNSHLKVQVKHGDES